MSSVNPTRATSRTCGKCGKSYTTALNNRKVCIKCKGINRKELNTLMTFPGVHVTVEYADGRKFAVA